MYVNPGQYVLSSLNAGRESQSGWLRVRANVSTRRNKFIDVVLQTQNVHRLICFLSMNVFIRIHIKCYTINERNVDSSSHRATGSIFRLCIRHGIIPINKHRNCHISNCVLMQLMQIKIEAKIGLYIVRLMQYLCALDVFNILA
jgi:hypothetical protein